MARTPAFTAETRIDRADLDGPARPRATGVGFLTHAGSWPATAVDLTIEAKGDLQVDAHHGGRTSAFAWAAQGGGRQGGHHAPTLPMDKCG
jgi:imidazoleglycerol phosphate dehydratase HisB